MGIQGLLPMLKEIQVHGHISDFKGKRLAIDGYVWLHKGAFGCAEQLVKGEKTTKFVDYAMHRIRLLKHFGITPYMVLDGGPLPAKKGTEVSRAKSRAENLAKAKALESQDRHREAREYYTKCLDITPELAYQLIKALRAEGVDYVVAPYEADPQLCFLEREGYVDGIITEDSDLLVFGCKQVIFKLDGEGRCVSINREQFSNISEFPMHGWTDLQFRRMAMLSGCDYLPSIPGIGIKTAHRLLRRYKTVEKLIQSLRLEGSHDIPDNYAAEFSQAELAFIFQRVFHPGKRRLVPLNDFPDDGLKEDDEKWVGLDVSIEIAQGMASGDLNPETRLPIVDPYPDFRPSVRTSDRGGSSTPLQPTKTISGPMDAFITRAPLPRPIGTYTSGPSRLSDQHILLGKTVPAKRDKLVKSKFFGGTKSAVQELEDAVRAAKEEIVWERSDEPDIESQLPDRTGASASSLGPVVESLRSPTPQLSPRQSSPATVQEGTVFTSPAGSRCSTPALSSPIHGDERSETTPSRAFKRRRLSSPCSPTRATGGARTPLVEETQEEDTLQSVITEVVFETPRPGRLSRLSSLHSVLVPQSSPQTVDLRSVGAVMGTSSDSVDEEEVVTPSVDMGRLLSRSNSSRSSVGASGKKRKTPPARTNSQSKQIPSIVKSDENVQPLSDGEEIEEVDEEEERRREKAKIVAAGWKKKYAVSTTAFPKPGRTRVHRDAAEHTDGMLHDPVFSPPPKKPLVQQNQNLGVDDTETRTPSVKDRLVAVAKEEVKTPVRSPMSAFQPGKMFSSLDKFRFTGKVKRKVE